MVRTTADKPTRPKPVWDDFFDAPGINLGTREQPEVQTRDQVVDAA